MNSQAVLSLTLAFLFFSGSQAAIITFNNKCPYTVWPGTLTGGQKTQLSETGFELTRGASSTVDVPSPWSGRFWTRTRCSNNAGRGGPVCILADPTASTEFQKIRVLSEPPNAGKFTCATGDCGSGQVACNGAGAVPPATLIELTMAAIGGQDFYDVSNVDGFNVPMSIAPQDGSGDCKPSSCPVNINTACPSDLQVKGSDGKVIACKSACLAFNKPEYCCTGSFAGGPDKCPPTNYSQFFEKQCPDAYSYAYDDKNSTFTCNGGPNYVITFCP